ncbi:hypothetical protein JOM56_009016 [Amanita muscaria]
MKACHIGSPSTGMPPTASGLIKRRRSNETPAATELVISSAGVVQRTSNLEAPIISLSGAHSAEILSCRFDPAGQNIAACSADKYLKTCSSDLSTQRDYKCSRQKSCCRRCTRDGTSPHCFRRQNCEVL